MNTRKYTIILIFISMAGYWWSCTKADDYKKYLVGGLGELVYTGKADSLKVFPGHDRVLLTFVLLSDPTITGAKVYWNNRTDSSTMAIKRSAGVDTIRMYIDSLPEGVYNFEVTTFDAKGNRSVASDITANVYGDKYAATLLSIPVQFSTVIPGDSAFIVWGNYDPTIGLIGAEVNYMDLDGLTRDSVVGINDKLPTATFPSFQSGNAFQYKTLYLPEPTCIDTFRTDFLSLNIQ